MLDFWDELPHNPDAPGQSFVGKSERTGFDKGGLHAPGLQFVRCRGVAGFAHLIAQGDNRRSLNFDDFVRSFFLGGYEPTLPVLIFAKLKSGMSPEINAIATVALVLTAVIGVWAERFTRRMNKDS